MPDSTLLTKSHLTLKLVSGLLRELKTPTADKVLSALKGDWTEIKGMSIPSALTDYEADPSFVKREWLAYNVIRKNDFLQGITAADRKAAAVKAFLEADETCKDINLNGYRRDSSDPSLGAEAIISIAREKIRRLLSGLVVEDVFAQASFSGGASTRLPRKVGHPYYKFGGVPHVTPECASLALMFVKSVPLWAAAIEQDRGTLGLEIRKGGMFFTVPKDAWVDRSATACVDLNLLLQKGLGKCIRTRLKRVGVDLDDQSHNQHLALIGSRTGALATLDLKSASDLINLRIVHDLLPPDICDLVEVLREKYCAMGGTRKKPTDWHELSKVSAMGNGFTFELESLIFWGLVQGAIQVSGCSDRRFAVYGDDLIVHHEVAPYLCNVLHYVGFSLNQAKSFISGPFRESCGKHYFLGHDVTPFQVKASLEPVDRLYWFINSLSLWMGSDLSLDRFRAYAIRQLNAADRIRIPGQYGRDQGIYVPDSTFAPFYSLRRNAFLFKVRLERRVKHKPGGAQALLAWLHGRIGGRAPCDGRLWIFTSASQNLREWKRGGLTSHNVCNDSIELEIEKGEPRSVVKTIADSRWCDVPVTFGPATSKLL